MDLLFLFYIFLSAVVSTGGAYAFITKGQTAAAGIFFAGMIIVLFFFGFRWFTASGETTASQAGPWPPVVNMCPDYLTLYTMDGAPVCIDTVGVSSGLKKWTGPTQTGDDFKFNLFTTASGDDRVQKLCNECKTKQVTWEGVYDGSVCIGNEPPKPPATS